MKSPIPELSTLQPYQNSPLADLPPPPSPPVPTSSAGGGANFLDIAKRHALVIVGIAAAYFGYSAWKVLNQDTLYQGNFQILVEPVNAENASLAAPTNGASNNAQRSAALDYPTQIAILKSPELLNEVIEELRQDYSQLSYGDLANQLDIKRLGETKMLQVTYQSEAADLTQSVLDALADKYLQYSLNERQTYLRQGLQFVGEQLDSLNADLNDLQNEFEAFQKQNNFVDPEMQSTRLNDSLTNLAQQQQELEASLVNIQAQAEVLQQDQGIEVLLEQDSAYQQLLAEVQAIDAQIAREITRFRSNNPAIETLEKQRANLLPLLEQQAERYIDTRLAEVTIQQQAVETQLESVKAKRDQLESQLQVLPSLNRAYGNIQRELEITNKSLTSFLETRQALQVEAAQQEIPWELVRQPVTAPMASNVAKSLAMALLTGLALGGAVAYALNKLDNTYHNSEDLKRAIKLPVLGVLPFNQQLFLTEGLTGKQRRRKLLSRLKALAIKASAKVSKSMSAIALSLLDEYDTSAEFIEALRMMHVNLLMKDTTRTARVVTISSAAPGDGKSTLALNWAEIAVSIGQRVLLIDAALRAPQLHQVLGLPNQLGLSTLLAQDLNLAQGIQQVRDNEKLYAVTAGPLVENPATLLSSPKLPQIIDYYRRIFDLIIIDTPAIGGLADAAMVNRHTDGLILVVRLEQTNKTVLAQAVETIESNHNAVLGMVINGHKGHNLALREATLSSEMTSQTESL
jgi:polysaccharide biosynthesis transport protein